MKRWTFLGVSAIAVAILLGGCGLIHPVVGSGRLESQSYGLAGFTRLEASNAFVVKLVPDTRFSVLVTSDNNLGALLIVEKTGPDTLRLALDPSHTYVGVTVRAEVHMPAVASIDASGASSVTATQSFAQGISTSVTLSGASLLTLSYLSCSDLTLDLSGASTATIAGLTGNETVTASGGSHANIVGCAGTQANVDLSGASDATVNAQAITLTASGASTLYYLGSPAIVTRDLSGGSRIVNVN